MLDQLKYVAPHKKMAIDKLPYTARCPLNTLFVDLTKCPNSNIINVFKYYSGFIELKKVGNFVFVTFDTTDNAKCAINNFYDNLHEGHPDVYVTYADAPTISTKNKNYEYKKYRRN